MNILLLFLLKSTLSLSLLYIAYRLLMHRETFFKLNRTVLLLAVLYSMTIPFLYSPKLLTVQPELKPVFQHVTVSEEPIQAIDEPITVSQSPQPITVREIVRPVKLSASTIFTIVYLTGVFISFLLLAYSIGTVLLLFRKARKTEFNGIRLMIVDDEMPAFSFGRNILISRDDYENNSEAIITHEQSHIRLGHFYDLMLMELVKIIFWFNPLVYRIMRDLKEIHEFQADDQALNSGIDATKYQLLIIQKSVGHQKFALANSFNHCQIKNRIVMMNKQKTSKAWRWKVATFLPLLALLLIFCGRKGNNVPVDQNKQENRLDTIINGKKLIVKDTTQYDSSFIKELKESYAGYETLIVKDDSFLITTHLKFPGKDTVVTHKYTIPTNLELNKEIVFSAKNEGKSLVLKRTNYTNIEYQIKNAKETIKSGTAILQSTFYLGAEMDHDENGKEIVSRQYLNQGSDWAAITVELYDAKIASITYCVDPKAKKYETLSHLLRE